MKDDSLTGRDPLVGSVFQSTGLRLKIIGIGGAGTNAVDRIKLDDLQQVHLAAIDTDSQVLASSPVEEKILLGELSGRGTSTGGQIERGKRAAEESEDLLRRCVEQVDLVFLLAGMGGGTGGGAAPVVAEFARDEGALVIAFVAMPFKREGKMRIQRAEESLEVLRRSCHAVIQLPNDIVFKHIDPDATVMEAFARADQWIQHGVHAIWSMLFNTGLMNVDFATLQSALAAPGKRTVFGTGYGKGANMVDAALQDLQDCPLLNLPDVSSNMETDQLILHITGGPDLTMAKVNQIMDAVGSRFSCENSVVMGSGIDGGFYQQLRITVIGTTRPRMGMKRGFEPVPAASIAPNKPVEKEELPRSSSARPMALNPRELAEVERNQEEFSFSAEREVRGLFDQTNHNLHEGEDLDIPTYIRRGIRLPRL